ncbi:37S ribosomal protein S4-like [Drechslerella dactyloides]|uniref:37S ribosomal protein S4-like n=1 Tax=Drechslerella dactyloides TaxID=74499 RepID=A0AAD6IR52_DREDA|nr:37S ribosomal protein S4-like [Drechslerella dactyloides]
MAKQKLFSLKRPRPRQSWNKHNVYNLFRYRLPQTTGRTFFQQKFRAKQETRRWNGEYLTERKWNSMFRHTLRGVIRMSPAEMAAGDGSAAVAGRGSGVDVVPRRAGSGTRVDAHERPIPFPQMTFAPLERRLDTAVYRALFASSVRQARSFCVHGKVSVNGKKMPHAGYMLNPGDMFSVDPMLVMRAIGNESTRAFRRLSEPAKDALETAIKSAARNPKSATFLKSADTTTLSSNADAEIDAEAFTKSTAETEPNPTTAEAESQAETTAAVVKAKEKDFKLPANWRSYLPRHPRWKIYDSWEPKRFMNLFAYIPRYLEVNHNICHAVYLRHPVARSGSAEIPNPFNNETMQLAYNWYLRRR